MHRASARSLRRRALAAFAQVLSLPLQGCRAQEHSVERFHRLGAPVQAERTRALSTELGWEVKKRSRSRTA
jgi:hypothetical protein